MRVNFYLEGGLVPVAYHYYMRTSGIVEEYRHRPKTGELMMVVLERGSIVPTEGQDIAIGIMKTVNPDWIFTFYFQRET